MNNAREFADKGIDIFNASDDFFNDKCKYYDINLDITIQDRREDIFQDVIFVVIIVYIMVLIIH